MKNEQQTRKLYEQWKKKLSPYNTSSENEDETQEWSLWMIHFNTT